MQSHDILGGRGIMTLAPVGKSTRNGAKGAGSARRLGAGGGVSILVRSHATTGGGGGATSKVLNARSSVLRAGQPTASGGGGGQRMLRRHGAWTPTCRFKRREVLCFTPASRVWPATATGGDSGR
eukprot:1090151-Amphidinium_carterae.1